MSRLEKIQRKNFIKSLIILLILLFLLLFSFITIGLNIILTASSFIYQTFKKNELTITPSQENFALIDIISIPPATNSAQFLVSGNTLNVDVLEIFINDKKTKEISLSSDTFTTVVGDLEEGENTVYFVGKDKNKKTVKKTNPYTIIYKLEKPTLTIKEPVDGETTEKEEIKVVGSTDKETFIKINDIPVVVDALGNFQSTVKLQTGENKIKITAEDQAGNIEEKILTVNYQKED
jgi:hypothetical protein